MTTIVCSDCNLTLGKTDFSKSQLKKKATETRRCLSCAKIVDGNSNSSSNDNAKSNNTKSITQVLHNSCTIDVRNKQIIHETSPIDASDVGEMYFNSRLLCSNPSCDTFDTKEKPHKQCVKCKCATYCSQKCYKEHYPIHKLMCLPTNAFGSHDKNDIVKDTPAHRVKRFKENYSPLLTKLTFFFLWNGPDVRQEGAYSTTVLHIEVEDLPSSAKYPRLRIKNMHPVNVEKGLAYGKSMREGFHGFQKMAAHTSGLPDTLYVCAVLIITHRCPNAIKENRNAVTSILQPYYFSNKDVLSFNRSLGLDTTGSKSLGLEKIIQDNNGSVDQVWQAVKSRQHELINSFSVTINEMATSNAKDYKAAAKMKDAVN